LKHTFASFAEVKRLDADALKSLLVAGEPPERVWAAWELGLRHDRAFARELPATAAEEPHAGVRRHLVVVLAGAGEIRSVLTMAVHDPDDRVRATALQYVARLAQPGDAEANDLLGRTLAGGTPPLRLGCIAGLRADAPVRLWNAVDACVSDPDRALRWAAYEAVMRHGAVARSAPDLARVFLNLEPERSTRQDALELLHERAGAAGLLTLLDDVALDARVVSEVVEALHEHDVRLEWVDVERLLARFPDAERLHRVLQLLVVGGEGPARAALLRLFVADRVGRDQSWAMRQEIRARLRRALDDNRGPLDKSERALRWALSDFVDKLAAAARVDPEFFDETYDADPELPCTARADQPLDPLSFSWFCEEEREILARLAALEVH